ncbi:50S ribosomal protein L28 [Candidatus Microgenomates bacterium]|nr:50S ribosomal protein L28 [Candidatus Microgenomates bacterium]
MSFRCEICGKGSQYGHNVSHSKRRTRKIWKPNLQKKTIDGKKMLLCTKCIKKLKKTGKLNIPPKTASK